MVRTRQFEEAANEKAPFYNAKENFVSNFLRTVKGFFSIFWFMYALKHREYSLF